MFGLLSALEVLDTVLLRVMVDDVAVGRAIGWLEPDCASLLRAGDHIKQTGVHRMLDEGGVLHPKVLVLEPQHGEIQS